VNQQISASIKDKVTLANIFVCLVSAGLFISVFIVDKSRLPEGWELPKVYFWQLFCLVFVIAALIYGLFCIVKQAGSLKDRKQVSFYGIFWGLAVFLIFIMLVIISFQSEYMRIFYVRTVENPLYKILISLVAGRERFVEIPVGIVGNRFRDFGLITVVLIVLFSQQLKRFVTRSNWHLISLAFIFSALAQSAIGLFQFLGFVQTSPHLIAEGQWIFGTFGQTNFYVGHLIVGMVLSLFYLRSRNKIVMVSSLISVMVIVLGIVISWSMWGYLILGLALILVFGYEILAHKKFLLFSGVIFSTMFLAFIYIVGNITDLLPEYSFRVTVWSNIINIYAAGLFNNSGDPFVLRRFVLGTGFDTLGHVFRDFGVLSRWYIDRAHNIFLDIFVSAGMLGLIAVAVFFGRMVRLSVARLNDRKIVYGTIVMVVLLVRAMVHTCSISNLMDLVVTVVLLSEVCPQVGRASNYKEIPRSVGIQSSVNNRPITTKTSLQQESNPNGTQI